MMLSGTPHNNSKETFHGNEEDQAGTGMTAVVPAAEVDLQSAEAPVMTLIAVGDAVQGGDIDEPITKEIMRKEWNRSLRTYIWFKKNWQRHRTQMSDKKSSTMFVK